MKLHDLNTMEAEFLEVIGYGLFVRQEEFDQWKHAVEGCRIHVERMSMDGYQYYLDNLIQAVLLSLGLSGHQQQPKQQQQQQQQQRHVPPPSTTFEDDNRRRYKDALEQQERAIWEAALEASRLQVENRQRQHNLYLYAKAHALDTWGPPETPTLPRRQTAPPPPISRQGSNCSNSSTSLLPPPLSSTPDRRASFASSMMLPTAAEYFHDTARKVDFFQAPEHLDTRASKYEYHYPPPGLVKDPSYHWNHSHPVSWSYPLPETPAVTPSWCKDFL